MGRFEWGFFGPLLRLFLSFRLGGFETVATTLPINTSTLPINASTLPIN